ncbi:glutamyl-tRNA(Gln) amidotransferase subunit A, mitochondrial [[Candida] jaroonii]|uniref:Glutamyl-tRNA(Gln) amidotransferase subunit A, mitochondrial n=1 Tax=[Candida] jaroonii TaxID=467808 RepID=A0ACA9YAI8_9ASCO|nr:glutamyl-tRNA(Gln) amidotransferase subunit A, mitochondrial [[Candida] jaroonii]
MLKRVLSRSYTTIDRWNSIITTIESTGGKYKYVAKDNILHKGLTTCASEILSNFESPYDATVIELLNKDMDLIGKANLDQFGMGSATANTIYGTVINPLFEDDDYITGGSSGGSAAAVAANLCDFSLGTDTGGSVRSPASNCGLYGYKPSYGRISRWGVIPYAQSLDTVGIITREMNVMKEVFTILDQYDDKDPTSMPQDIRDKVAKAVEVRNRERNGKYVFGIPEEIIVEELTDEVKYKLSLVIEKLLDLGHTVVPVSVPSIKKSISTYYAIATSEASSNFSRLDGIRYGKDHNFEGGDETIRGNRSKGFGEVVRKRIVLGNYSISADSGDFYSRAVEVRQQISKEFNEIFYLPHQMTNPDGLFEDPSKVDFLVTPATINKPLKISDYIKMEENSMDELTNDILSLPMSLGGLPAVSVPIKDKGLDISTQGIQISGQYGDDYSVLDMGDKIIKEMNM